MLLSTGATMPRARSVLAVTRMVRIGAEVTQQSDINAIEGANAYERGIEMGIGVRGVLRHSCGIKAHAKPVCARVFGAPPHTPPPARGKPEVGGVPGLAAIQYAMVCSSFGKPAGIAASSSCLCMSMLHVCSGCSCRSDVVHEWRECTWHGRSSPVVELWVSTLHYYTAVLSESPGSFVRSISM